MARSPITIHPAMMFPPQNRFHLTKKRAISLIAAAGMLGALVLSLTTCGLPAVRVPSESLPASPSEALAEKPNQASRHGLARYEALRSLAHVSVLAGEIGERVSESEGETQAVEYISSHLREYGYDVEVMRFAFDDDYLLPASVAVEEEVIQGLAISGSAAGSVTTEVIHVGHGNSEGFAGKVVRGKIALADRSNEHLYDAILHARRGGAAALVVINGRQGLIGGWFRPHEPLLVVEVGSAAGDALRGAAEFGRPVTVQAATNSRREAMNVIARQTPSSHCDMMVGGHHDTVPASPGANDNASGIATVLELARAFASRAEMKALAGEQHGQDSLCFVTFGAEEAWWHGSLALVERLQAEEALPRVMVNLDVTGIGNAVEIVASPDLAGLALEVAQTHSIRVEEPKPTESMNSDHRSFVKAGVPVLFLTSGAFPTVHSPADVAAGINPASLQRVGDLAFATIVRLTEEAPDGAPQTISTPAHTTQ